MGGGGVPPLRHTAAIGVFEPFPYVCQSYFTIPGIVLFDDMIMLMNILLPVILLMPATLTMINGHQQSFTSANHTSQLITQLTIRAACKDLLNLDPTITMFEQPALRFFLQITWLG